LQYKAKDGTIGPDGFFSHEKRTGNCFAAETFKRHLRDDPWSRTSASIRNPLHPQRPDRSPPGSPDHLGDVRADTVARTGRSRPWFPRIWVGAWHRQVLGRMGSSGTGTCPAAVRPEACCAEDVTCIAGCGTEFEGKVVVDWKARETDCRLNCPFNRLVHAPSLVTSPSAALPPRRVPGTPACSTVLTSTWVPSGFLRKRAPNETLFGAEPL
jgi:hypothetical protein